MSKKGNNLLWKFKTQHQLFFFCHKKCFWSLLYEIKLHPKFHQIPAQSAKAIPFWGWQELFIMFAAFEAILYLLSSLQNLGFQVKNCQNAPIGQFLCVLLCVSAYVNFVCVHMALASRGTFLKSVYRWAGVTIPQRDGSGMVDKWKVKIRLSGCYHPYAGWWRDGWHTEG